MFEVPEDTSSWELLHEDTLSQLITKKFSPSKWKMAATSGKTPTQANWRQASLISSFRLCPLSSFHITTLSCDTLQISAEPPKTPEILERNCWEAIPVILSCLTRAIRKSFSKQTIVLHIEPQRPQPKNSEAWRHTSSDYCIIVAASPTKFYTIPLLGSVISHCPFHAPHDVRRSMAVPVRGNHKCSELVLTSVLYDHVQRLGVVSLGI